MSTGEASGDMLAASLAEELRRLEPNVSFSGIGGERMAAAGFTLSARTRGWASLGPIEALRRIPSLLAVAVKHALGLARRPPDLIVFIDFGAFNLRIANALRRLRYRRPVLYYFPPGAWFDRPEQARAVARCAIPLTPFAHQRDFYRGLGLRIAYFGHPLVSLVSPRSPRPPAPPDGGTVALLPGSRAGEIERHAARMFAACAILRQRRPRLEVVVAAADADCERLLQGAIARAGFDGRVVYGARAALDACDGALIASGTAVLEAALREVPLAALYVVSRAQVRIAKRIWKRPFITLPNLILGREVVPELLQDAATPEALARAVEALLADPARQLDDFRALRAQLGPPDALARCAEFALALARGGDEREAA